MRPIHFIFFCRSFQSWLGTKVKLSTAFHPQTDGLAELTIQTLEDVLKSSVIDFKGNLDDHTPLIEFTYTNSYHSSISMDSFETFYERNYRSPIGSFGVGGFALICPTVVHEVLEKVQLVWDILNASQTW